MPLEPLIPHRRGVRPPAVVQRSPLAGQVDADAVGAEGRGQVDVRRRRDGRAQLDRRVAERDTRVRPPPLEGAPPGGVEDPRAAFGPEAGREEQAEHGAPQAEVHADPVAQRHIGHGAGGDGTEAERPQRVAGERAGGLHVEHGREAAAQRRGQRAPVEADPRERLGLKRREQPEGVPGLIQRHPVADRHRLGRVGATDDERARRPAGPGEAGQPRERRREVGLA